MKMKKIILFALVVVLSLGMSTAFAAKANPGIAPENVPAPNKTENKLSEEELSRMTKRVEEIRDMDKTKMTTKEKRVLRKELKEIKENVRKDGGVIYIGVGTLVLIIILVVILL